MIGIRAPGHRSLPAAWFTRLALPAGLATATYLAPTYISAYAFLAALFVCLCATVNRYARPLFLIVSAYLLVALPNISSWRGYIDAYTLKLYALSVLAMYVPFIMVPDKLRLRLVQLKATPIVLLLLGSHLTVVFGAVAYIYATHGAVILQQDLRFGIPPSLEYVVKSPLPLAAFSPFMIRRLRTQVLFVLVVVLPTVLVGARGAAVVALLSYALCRTYGDQTLRDLRFSRRTVMAGVAALSAVVISLGFYLRRSEGGPLAPASVIARTYFDDDSWWVYALMPVHLGFRETVGLTNRIISTGQRNDVNENALFVADLFTVLPGEQMAAGQSLGQIFGAAEAGGLTPGLLGGLYLDFGEGSLLFIAVIGAFVVMTLRMAFVLRRFTPIYAVVLVQVIHLFHRGFLKPEYFTTIAIGLLYATLSRPAAGHSSNMRRPAGGGSTSAEAS